MRIALTLIFGLAGCALLLGLGIWQVQRLEWKSGILAEIEARIAAPAEPLPQVLEPETDRYTPVRVSGTTTGTPLHVLVSPGNLGAGYRVISPFETPAGRRLMVDLGFIPQAAKDQPLPPMELTVHGNLHWPRETDGFTPAPDRARNIWFARDVPEMAEALGTEPLLVVLRHSDALPARITPLPVGTEGIPNDHLGYAITWFSLAAIWAGMTGLLLWRMQRKTA